MCHAKQTDLHIQSIIAALENEDEVSEILLNHNCISNAGAILLSEYLCRHSNITSIELFGNELGDDCCKSFAKMLKVNTTLRRLKLGDNQIGPVGASALSEGLLENRSLTQLHLGGNKIGVEGLDSIAAALLGNTVLTSLGLRDNAVGPTGMRGLSSTLKHESCVLSDIQLKGNNIQAAGSVELASALEVNVSLKVLELQSNQIGPSGCSALCQALRLNHSVHALNFNDNELGDDGAEAVGELLLSNSCITTLGLANNHIRKRGAEALARALGTASGSLTGLDLGSNDLGNGGTCALAEALKQNTVLTSLDLRSCNIHLKGIVAMADCAMVNTTLRHLDFGANHAKNHGATAWASVLAHNTTLTRLCLTDNQIFHEGGQALAEGLRNNTTLRNFSYGGQGPSGNRIDTAIRRMIDGIVQENKRDWEATNKESGGASGTTSSRESKSQRPSGFRQMRLGGVEDSDLNLGGNAFGSGGDAGSQLSSSSGPPFHGGKTIHGGGSSPFVRFPSWLISVEPLKSHEAAILDENLDHLFRNGLLKAENPKFPGSFFLGNIMNTLRKYFPASQVNELQLTRFAFDSPRYHVHLSQELVKTQIKYVGDLAANAGPNSHGAYREPSKERLSDPYFHGATGNKGMSPPHGYQNGGGPYGGMNAGGGMGMGVGSHVPRMGVVSTGAPDLFPRQHNPGYQPSFSAGHRQPYSSAPHPGHSASPENVAGMFADMFPAGALSHPQQHRGDYYPSQGYQPQYPYAPQHRSGGNSPHQGGIGPGGGGYPSQQQVSDCGGSPTEDMIRMGASYVQRQQQSPHMIMSPTFFDSPPEQHPPHAQVHSQTTRPMLGQYPSDAAFGLDTQQGGPVAAWSSTQSGAWDTHTPDPQVPGCWTNQQRRSHTASSSPSDMMYSGGGVGLPQLPRPGSVPEKLNMVGQLSTSSSPTSSFQQQRHSTSHHGPPGAHQQQHLAPVYGYGGGVQGPSPKMYPSNSQVYSPSPPGYGYSPQQQYSPPSQLHHQQPYPSPHEGFHSTVAPLSSPAHDVSSSDGGRQRSHSFKGSTGGASVMFAPAQDTWHPSRSSSSSLRSPEMEGQDPFVPQSSYERFCSIFGGEEPDLVFQTQNVSPKSAKRQQRYPASQGSSGLAVDEESSDLLSYNSGLLSDDGSRPSSSMSTDEHALSGASSASRGLLPNHSSGAGSAGASSAMHPPGGGRVRTSSMPPKSTAPCQQWAQGYPPPGGGSTFPVAAISTPPYSVGPGPTPGQQSQQSIHSQEVSPSKTGSTPMTLGGNPPSRPRGLSFHGPFPQEATHSATTTGSPSSLNSSLTTTPIIPSNHHYHGGELEDPDLEDMLKQATNLDEY